MASKANLSGVQVLARLQRCLGFSLTDTSARVLNPTADQTIPDRHPLNLRASSSPIDRRESRRCKRYAGTKFGLLSHCLRATNTPMGLRKGVCSSPQTRICRFLLINRSLLPPPHLQKNRLSSLKVFYHRVKAVMRRDSIK
ncbi:hypothetical protein CEXT_348341 [Caerostris extrusa]|uniref:Uncharacterized protein n=1 Tax=Caerostris extrusa TaxID=172846 RepID=A0AAV4MPL5_CAEEX|nr:hypothetical protein CEXT_348341 [Caerostris extrusa]